MRSTRTTLLIIVAVVLFLTILFSNQIALFLTDLFWFRSPAIGYEKVFYTQFSWRLGVGASLGAICFVALIVQVLWVRRRTEQRTLVLPKELAATPVGQFLMGASLTKLASMFCIFMALIIAMATSSWGLDFLFYANRMEFGVTDPILGHEAGFYVFTLPLLSHLVGLATAVIVLSALVVAVLYNARGAISLKMGDFEGRPYPKGVEIQPVARRHLTLLACALLIAVAGRHWLGRYGLMFSQGPLLAGPGYAAVFGTLPLLTIQTIATALASILLFVGLDRNRRGALIAAAALVIAPWALSAVYPGVVQKFSVVPNEPTREGPYLAHHIKATRFAFGLEEVDERELSGDSRLTMRDIENNRATINNIRLWDHQPLLDTFSQRQELRPYYEFENVDNDRYMLNGELRQMMLSPRELVSASLPNRTWVNETMIFTHGYGVAMGPVNQITPEGLPVLFVRDLPPKWSYPEFEITRPEIYFGELMQNPVLVETKRDEFDYPSGEENKFTRYKGKAGVPVTGSLTRLLFSIRLGSMDLMMTREFTSKTRLLIYRDILDRARRIAPFLQFDSDPYMVLTEGRLIWILDGYTTSKRFPYSRAIGQSGVNYMRNSVKIVVDAYHGTVDFYIIDPDDPIIQAWNQAFPGMMRKAEDIPAPIRAHLRYPQDFFSIQTALFALYHMEDEQIFYNREDEWQLPVVDDRRMEPYYTVMKLPGEEREEFILMLPFTPKDRPNLAAWMVARSDGEYWKPRAGRLVAYRFPKEKLIYGPAQMAARINQDDEISPQISLWNQQGSEVIYGTLLVIPIEESLIYIQPLYLSAEKGAIPQLKRVIVGDEENIVMEQTLEEALRRLFGEAGASELAGGATDPDAELPALSGEGAAPWQRLAGEASRRYEAANRASRDGDWARYGEEIKSLGEILERLRRTQDTPPTPEP